MEGFSLDRPPLLVESSDDKELTYEELQEFMEDYKLLVENWNKLTSLFMKQEKENKYLIDENSRMLIINNGLKEEVEKLTVELESMRKSARMLNSGTSNQNEAISLGFSLDRPPLLVESSDDKELTYEELQELIEDYKLLFDNWNKLTGMFMKQEKENKSLIDENSRMLIINNGLKEEESKLLYEMLPTSDPTTGQASGPTIGSTCSPTVGTTSSRSHVKAQPKNKKKKKWVCQHRGNKGHIRPYYFKLYGMNIH
ncbi:hypothetical protein LIER_17364 [Lithospermum erythrorhizon]|uniref:Uncharacterized protein n=1 Tax=Lithospermum erythrorhizon TaxID=34254 RepID=A0AAV3QEE4_LITER